MKTFAFLLSIFIAIGVSVADDASTQLIDKAVYLKEIAPITLERINTYRQDHAASLSAEQLAVLTRAENLVKEYKVGEKDDVMAQCLDAFNRNECTYILTGKNGQKTTSVRSSDYGALLIRDPSLCECTQEHAWCEDGFCCQYKAGDCIFKREFESAIFIERT